MDRLLGGKPGAFVVCAEVAPVLVPALVLGLILHSLSPPTTLKR